MSDTIKYLSYEEVGNLSDEYKDILSREVSGHRLYISSNETIRWEKNQPRVDEIMKFFGADDLNDLFGKCQADKNDPLVRELYKCMGYSLSGFWEVFYWDWNNDKADEYNKGIVESVQYEEEIVRNKVKSFTCSCCKEYYDDILDIQEMMHWKNSCGYNSVFGDGNSIELVLCETCIKNQVGTYIKVVS